MRIVRVCDLEDGDYVWMVETRCSESFLFETMHALRIGGKLGRQHFERNYAAQRFIMRLKDLAHSSGADAFLDPIVADSGRRSEERRVGKECRCRWSPDH